ncbi:MAG: YncE family protein [Gemmatimonadota bacterium]|nr:YncE family protein [Gemmatimonadota bacterium]
MSALVAVTLMAMGSRAMAQHEQHAAHGTRPPASTADTALGTPLLAKSVVQNGVKVELTLARPAISRADASAVLEGEDVGVRFVFSDSATGRPLTDLSPAGWIDARKAGTVTELAACRDKIQSYLRGTLQVRPAVDLNSSYVLALTAGNAVAVYDPIVGFNISKLYAAAPLGSEGEDWALTPDNERLFVTMPQLNTVAVVNTSMWRVQTNIPVGLRPTRITFQPDGRYLWVVDGGPGGSSPGVTVIDPVSLAPVQHIPTGAGAREIAFSADGQYAFVANHRSGTVSTIDIRRFAVVHELPTGPHPMGLAWSESGKTVYVTHEDDGSIVVLDPARQQIVARLAGKPGVGAVAFGPGGRWGFAPNPAADEVSIIDGTRATIVDVLPFGTAPDQVAFTENFAYVRASGSPNVVMIPFDVLEAEGKAKVMSFETGRQAPAKYGSNATAAAIAPAAHHMADAIYVPNAAEKSIYLYHYMMSMPMPAGRVDTYPFEPKATLVVDRALRQTAPGVYQTTFKAPADGEWDVVFLLDHPRVVNCFDFQVAKNPEVKRETKPRLRITQVPAATTLPVGEATELRFRLADYYTDEPRGELTDLWVWVFSSRGWSQRELARYVEDGIYAVDLTLPRSGPYNLIVATKTLSLAFEDTFPLVIRAGGPEQR